MSGTKLQSFFIKIYAANHYKYYKHYKYYLAANLLNIKCVSFHVLAAHVCVSAITDLLFVVFRRHMPQTIDINVTRSSVQVSDNFINFLPVALILNS